MDRRNGAVVRALGWVISGHENASGEVARCLAEEARGWPGTGVSRGWSAHRIEVSRITTV